MPCDSAVVMEKLVFLCVALFFSAVSADIPHPFLGITEQTYNGSLTKCVGHVCEHNGYVRALEACQREFNDSRVCSSHDLGIIAQSDISLFVILGKGDARYIDMSFAEVFSEDQTQDVPLNDCTGFTSANKNSYSRCLREIIGGPILPSVCSCADSLSFLCCTDTY